MAETLPSPPLSRSSSQEPDLVTRLDELLEQYLELLDQYTTLREETSKTFSAGFFSLAQAQRASSLGAGRRYGEECYDERMKAQRRVVQKRTDSGMVVEVEKRLEVVDEQTIEAEQLDQKQVEKGQDESTLKDGSEKISSDISKTSTGRTKQNPATRDPITWFGILAPPALRQTQGHFAGCLDHSIPALINVESQMQDVEGEIWSVRRDLGVIDQYLEKDPEQTTVASSTAERFDKQQSPSKTVDSTKKKRSLTSRPAHAKSSMLKLGD